MLRLLLCAMLLVPGLAQAQDDQTQTDQTLADIRQELSILFVEVQRLRRELSTTGTPSVNLGGTSALARIDTMESELRRLTGRTEQLENRINRVVADGTNRVGDLEFRLCELEAACDIGALGLTPTLGGDLDSAPVAAPAPAPETGGAQLAIGEQSDFDLAKSELDAGNYQQAVALFTTFTETYTGGPLTGQAHFHRGQALENVGDTAGAARAYLEAFSGSPEGPIAPDALLALGLSLDKLGQREDACATLGEVTNRFPQAAASIEAQTARASLACL